MKRPFRRKRLQKWLAGTLDLASMLGLGKDDRDDILYHAKQRFEAGDLDEAERLYRLANTLFPNEADPKIGLGACEQTRGNFVLAMNHYRAAGSHFIGTLNLAECLLLTGNRMAARDFLERYSPGESRSYLPAEVRSRFEALEKLANQNTESEDSHSATPSHVVYTIEPNLSEAEFRSILERSTLAERRPMDDPAAIPGMLANANVIVTARLDELLVGVSRALTDHQFCTYLSDLAVDQSHQKHGIGRELIRRTHEAAGLKTTLILLAAPLARSYYPHIGMEAHDSCWIVPRIPS